MNPLRTTPSVPRATERARQPVRVGASGALVCLVILVLTLRADAQNSILHEFVPPDPNEDVSFSATTIDGDLPAALQTPSGVSTAPDPRRPPDSSHVYSGTTTVDGPESTYEPDRDTRRPMVENYDDPFSPATAPFKRLRAYDSVDDDYTLRVRDRALQRFAVGGSVGSRDEPFYGDFSVDLVKDEPVRIPSVGPGARILKMHSNPPAEIEFLRDGADNWFVRGKSRTRVRLVMEIAIARDVFGSALGDPDWSELEHRVAPPSAAHAAAYQEVARAIGISRAERPRQVITKMVEYFRSFAPSDQPPKEHDDIYLDLALSKKGVCRHRAFAFLVTALYAGIPTRMVVNEAHAWVEVFDGALWHRIDLGGAASNLEHDIDPTRPPYVPPADPFAWPASRDSGEDLAGRAREREQATESGQAPGTRPDATPSPTAQSSAAPIDPTRPTTDVVLHAIDKDVRRGLPLHLQGEVKSAGEPCAHVRVDVLLTSAEAADGVVIGSLSTNEHGSYDGAVVVPRDLAVGDYDLQVSTPGDARCAAGHSK